MTSARLQAALDSINDAFTRLEAAAEAATVRQEQTTAELDTAFAQASAENNFLKEDNLRLSNQLQTLQRDFLRLQETAISTINRLDDSVKQIDLILEH